MKREKLLYILLIIFILPITSFSQTKNIKKGQKSFTDNDIEEAWQYFNMAIIEKEDEIISNYYLAKINANTEFKNYNIFRAFTQIYYADSILKTKGGNYQLTLNDVIPDGTKTIGQAKIEIDDQLYEFVKTSNDLKLIERVAGECSGSAHYHELIEIRNKLEFENVEKKDEVASYNLFMERFPNSEFSDKARVLRNKRAFFLAKKENSVEVYNEFIMNYGNAIQFDSAVELRNKKAFDDALYAHTLRQYEDYLQYYPNSIHNDTVVDVRNALEFKLNDDKNTIESYQEYIDKYPYSIHAPAAIAARNFLLFKKANATLDLRTRLSYLNDFIYQFPNATQIDRALFLRDSIAYEQVIRTGHLIKEYNDYLVYYPNSMYIDKIIHVRDSLLMAELSSFGDLQRFNQILNNYPYFQFKKEAEIVRNQLAFDLAVKEGTQEALQRFIDFYPYAEQVEKATKMLSDF